MITSSVNGDVIMNLIKPSNFLKKELDSILEELNPLTKFKYINNSDFFSTTHYYLYYESELILHNDRLVYKIDICFQCKTVSYIKDFFKEPLSFYIDKDSTIYFNNEIYKRENLVAEFKSKIVDIDKVYIDINCIANLFNLFYLQEFADKKEDALPFYEIFKNNSMLSYVFHNVLTASEYKDLVSNMGYKRFCCNSLTDLSQVLEKDIFIDSDFRNRIIEVLPIFFQTQLEIYFQEKGEDIKYQTLFKDDAMTITLKSIIPSFEAPELKFSFTPTYDVEKDNLGMLITYNNGTIGLYSETEDPFAFIIHSIRKCYDIYTTWYDTQPDTFYQNIIKSRINTVLLKKNVKGEDFKDLEVNVKKSTFWFYNINVEFNYKQQHLIDLDISNLNEFLNFDIHKLYPLIDCIKLKEDMNTDIGYSKKTKRL